MTVRQPKVVRPSEERANPFNFKDNKKYITETSFLIGNGKSREGFDLERLRPFGTIVGCNALFREFSPDILLAIDAKMLREIHKANYVTEDVFCVIPKGRTVDLPHARKWKADKFNTTGCFGMHFISRLMKSKTCYMLGMDNHPGNIFDGTESYGPNTLQNFTGVGDFYLKALSPQIADTVFVNVNIKDSWPPESKNTGRYMYITYDEFEEIIQYASTHKKHR